MKALADLLMCKELAPFESVFAPRHGLNKASFFLEVTRNNVPNQLVRIAALPGCRVCQLRFESGGKVTSISSAPVAIPTAFESPVLLLSSVSYRTIPNATISFINTDAVQW